MGTVRFDLAGGGHTEHWFVTLNKGEVAVSHRNGRADAVVRVDRALFDELAAGARNAEAAHLRGAMDVEGNLALAMQFLRLLPGPPRTRRSRGSAKRPTR